MAHRRKCILFMMVVLALLFTSTPAIAQIDPPFDDLTPNEYTFTGRRGTSYTATWDPETYQVTFSTPNSTFPWDWMSFLGEQGAISLAGNNAVAYTFAFSSASTITGVARGDIMRVKARDIHNLAYLTKIGLVIGSGAQAQRAWFSDSTITEYTLTPESIGYTATVLGRQVTVRVSHVTIADFQVVGVIEVTIDDPTNARIYIASDLEPALAYRYAVEYHDTPDTSVSYSDSQEIIQGLATLDTPEEQYYGQPLPVYFYASEPLDSWSANNLSFDNYLHADPLDGQVAPGTHDGRVAMATVAQPVQYFYIGNVVLDDPTRADPTSLMDALGTQRLAALEQLPLVDAPGLPAFKFVNVMSNLLNSYLINPGGRVYAVDKAIIYAPDTLMPIATVSELLPEAFINAFQDMLIQFGDYRYGSPPIGQYWWKADGGYDLVPSWYQGNIVDTFYYLPDGRLTRRWQFSDAYSTAEYLNGLASVFRTTGDVAFLQSQEAAFDDVLAALQNFDEQYDSVYGEDGNLFPNLVMPMGDLESIQGEYPAETAQTIYAYQDAAHILTALGRTSEALDLLDNYVAPMQAAFDAAFWHSTLSFYAPVADQRNPTHNGEYYLDKWCQTVIPFLQRDMDTTRLPAMLATYTANGFYEPEGDVHWLSTDSENFAWPGRWGLDSRWTNGFVMQGGFLIGIPPVIPPLGYYRLRQQSEGDLYANIYLDRWVELGPHETMMEWNYQIPGRFLESSIYIEATIATTWLLKGALGLTVDGTTVTIAPILGDQFVVRNLHVTSQGMTAVLNYARDADGQEYIQIVSNEGLTINAPQASPTAVELTSFTATDHGSYVRVEWETASEQDNLGFNLYRSDWAQESWTRLNDSLIPSKAPGSPAGAAYWYDDLITSATTTYYYQLEDVDVRGKRTFYGPVPTVHRIYLPLVVKSP
jgi:hypothetical protein